MRKVFLDIETTGLDPLKNEILEVGMVVGYAGSEKVHFSLPIFLPRADERALEINKYHERKPALDKIQLALMDGVELLSETLTGALVIGNNVQFDLRFIEHFIGGAPWYYAPLDLKAFVAGRCGMDHPASTATIADVAGVPLSKDAHTALADATWNWKAYRALHH